MADQLDEWMCLARDEEDHDAFAAVLNETHHLIRATTLRECADGDLAEEIAQETFVRAWSKRHQYRTGTSPRAWLLSIARSQLLDYHRRNNREHRHLRDLIRQELMRRTPDDKDEWTTARLDALEECLTGVAGDQRELLDLVHQQGLTTDAAADVLGIKAAACRKRLSRLQQTLRQCAEKRLQDKL
ncbi:MAG: sigma-70 family RNA polymerase sigma factor [Planctomycetes bacterium]|nr:sigma-70 family RNA polymerase sigma factor [Planctomycetota bacterium]